MKKKKDKKGLLLMHAHWMPINKTLLSSDASFWHLDFSFFFALCEYEWTKPNSMLVMKCVHYYNAFNNSRVIKVNRFIAFFFLALWHLFKHKWGNTSELGCHTVKKIQKNSPEPFLSTLYHLKMISESSNSV